MAIHLTARLAWHDSGWNGRICRDPANNTYCVGCHSYPGEMIAEQRDLKWEKPHAGDPINQEDHISPCIYSANAFGEKRLIAYARPPEFFKDETLTRKWELPPASVCVWPYEVMYGEDIRQEGGGYDNDERRERAKAFFDQLSEDQSLVFYYANYSNPLSEDEAQRYLLIGLSRIKAVGDELMYLGCSERVRQRYGGGFVWDRTITSHYPEQGLRLPYHVYLDRPELLERFALSPENPRTCKYGSRHLSDDDALGLVEQFLVAVTTLQEIGDKSEDWATRKNWLQNLIGELWQSRGLYPGLPAVLQLLNFSGAIPFFKAEAAGGREQQAYAAIFSVLEGTSKALPGVKISDDALRKLIKKGHGVGAAVIALAPTGKAADRIRAILEKDDSLKGAVETRTIHSFLATHGWLNDNLTFKRAGAKIEQGYSTYIIDESSMLDLNLAAALFRSIDWKTVQRLILVGDPNQLPPIGFGRVFADIIDYLSAKEPDSIATLTDNLRLLENRTAGRGTGILDLANAYIRQSLSEKKDQDSDSAAEAILRKVQEGGDVDKDLRALYWNNAEELAAQLIERITGDFEEDTGKKRNLEKPYEIWRAGFNNRPEASQVLTPYRGELFGIEAINTAIQKHIGQGMIDKVGALDGITLFDKVIQVRNRPKSNMAYAYRPSTRSNEKIELFNGELGFVKPHGLDRKAWLWQQDFWLRHFQVVFGRKPDVWVNYGTRLGSFDTNRWVPRQPVEDNLELAYAISVHKAQGSEFERTYVIVPKSKTALLSPELFYTAVTRATRHCTLMIEQDVSVLINIRRREKSHLLHINSSLFEFRPVPEPLLNLGGWYEEGKIHEVLVGDMVRSKSEVIIANLLTAAGIPFRYEVPLFAPDGTFYLPDFTIDWRGQKFFWEHLGMLRVPKYKKDWEQKKKWYNKHFPEALLMTEESPTLSKAAKALIDATFVR